MFSNNGYTNQTLAGVEGTSALRNKDVCGKRVSVRLVSSLRLVPEFSWCFYIHLVILLKNYIEKLKDGWKDCVLKN